MSVASKYRSVKWVGVSLAVQSSYIGIHEEVTDICLKRGVSATSVSIVYMTTVFLRPSMLPCILVVR